MDFLLNDRSLHGQYHDGHSFRRALGVVMQMRAAIQRHGRSLHCHRTLLDAKLGPDLHIQQAVQALPRDQQRAVMAWVTQHGPYWQDLRTHGPDDWLEWREEIVTETAIGVAAFAAFHGLDRRLVSFAPSEFVFTPVDVDWVRDGDRSTTSVANYWAPEPIQAALEEAPPPIQSWADVETVARARFDALRISADAFEALAGHPFVPGAAERLVVVLGILDRLRRCFDEGGARTPEGHEIYRNFFTGVKGNGGRGALFSDSSDSDKADFQAEMTFKHPDDPKDTLFCSWHGKVQTPQLRVHFSTPIRANTPLYVVYVGPKITKR